MYKRLSTLLLITVLGTSSQLYAAPMKEESLNKLIQLSNVEQQLQQTATDMRPAIEKQAEFIIQQGLSVQQLNPKQQQAAQQLTDLLVAQNQQLMKNPKFLQMIKNIYQKTYSEEEAQAYIAFLSTPQGQSIAKKGNALANEILQQSTQLAIEVSKEPGQQQAFLAQLQKILQPLIAEQQKAKK